MYGTIVGRIGKLELKEVNGGSVLSLSLVEKKYIKGVNVDTWYQVAYWGKRAESIFPILFVGQNVSAVGQSYQTTYNDKQYMKMDAQDIIPQSWPKDESAKKEEPKNNNHYESTTTGQGSMTEWPEDNVPI